jgi:hypothetical protein
MAKLINLKLEEFSIVAGPDLQPANPEAKAWLYKASSSSSVKEKEDDMKVTKTANPGGGNNNAPQPESLASVIGKSVRDAIKGWTRTSSYSSTSQSTEKMEEDATAHPAAEVATDSGGGSTTIVITDAVAKSVTPTPAQSTAKTDKGAGVAALFSHGRVADAFVKATEADALVKALETSMAPVANAVAALDNRLKAVEKTSTGSRAVPKHASLDPIISDKKGFGDFAKFLVEKSGLTPGQRLSKATISSSGWTYGLSTTEAGQFIDYVFNLSTLLSQIRTVQMPDKKYFIDKIDLGGRVLRKGTPGVDPGDTVSTSNPTQVQLDAKEVVAIVSIGDDTLEDNIEGEAFVEHLLRMIANAAANELEQAALHGDTAVADAGGINDIWDGFYKRAKAGGQVIEAMADANRFWPGANGSKATRLLKRIPVKYRQDYRNLAVLLHNDLYLDYMDELASKGYSEAWTAITGMADVPVRSIKNIRLPLAKTDMGFTYGPGSFTDGTFVMITDLRNLIMGIHRNIKIEPYRQPRKRATDYILSMRGDVQIENPEAIGLYDHAKVA